MTSLFWPVTLVAVVGALIAAHVGSDNRLQLKKPDIFRPDSVISDMNDQPISPGFYRAP